MASTALDQISEISIYQLYVKHLYEKNHEEPILNDDEIEQIAESPLDKLTKIYQAEGSYRRAGYYKKWIKEIADRYRIKFLNDSYWWENPNPIPQRNDDRLYVISYQKAKEKRIRYEAENNRRKAFNALLRETRYLGELLKNALRFGPYRETNY